MKRALLALVLLALPYAAVAHEPDRERELSILVDYYARTNARSASEAAKTIADLLKVIEALKAENAALQQKILPSGQPGGR